MKKPAVKIQKSNIIFIAILLASLALNIAARMSAGFADAYRATVFDAIQNVYSRITGIFSFSVGEFMILAGIILVIVTVIFGIIMRRMKVIKFFLWTCNIVFLVMTLNCYILYQATSFSDMYISDGNDREYTVEELAALREYCITEANTLAEVMERDENGYLVYDGNIKETACREMERLAATYPLLEGYYPNPKGLISSKLMSQQYMMGYFFPFSMEANYNTRMYISNMPATMCHELSHLQGVILEDDANFIGYLACVTSEDDFFRYCGYLSVIDYLNNDLYKSVGKDRSIYNTFVQCSDLVDSDNIFLTEEAWDEVEETAIVSTETMKQASHTFLETNLNLNGVYEGTASYGNVVKRMLQYYEGELF